MSFDIIFVDFFCLASFFVDWIGALDDLHSFDQKKLKTRCEYYIKKYM